MTISLLLFLAGCFLLPDNNQGSSSSSSSSSGSSDPVVIDIDGGSSSSGSSHSSGSQGSSSSGSSTGGSTMSLRECREITDGGEVKGPACVTDIIECGDTIKGHTRGGTDNFNTRWWEKNYCWPATENHNGGDERVYMLKLPREKLMATVKLDTPCADLDVMAFPWNNSGCPGQDDHVARCECLRKKGTKSETIKLVSQEADTWLIVVEGVGEEEGAFQLNVECGEWY